MEGPEEKGGAVSLRCKVSLGSTPLSYTWKRETGGAVPPDATLSEDTSPSSPSPAPLPLSILNKTCIFLDAMLSNIFSKKRK